MTRIKPHFGSAVEGEQRFPRPHLEQRLLRLLEGSNGVSMFGLRRTAKSTFTRWVEQELAKTMSVVSVDAQGYRALDHLLFDVLRRLSQDQKVGSRLISWISSGSGVMPETLRQALKLAAEGVGAHSADTSSAISAYWMVIADQIATELRREPKPRMLLAIDEFPFLCKGILEVEGAEKGRATVNQLLAALRLWRDAGLKMLLTGSIGMAALERRHLLDPVHLNDMRPFAVPPLGDRDPSEPSRFIDALVAGSPDLQGWTAGHTQALLDESVVFYPSFLQFAFASLTSIQPLPAPSDFAEIFACEIRPDLNGPFLDQFDARLKGYRSIETVTEASACAIMGCVVQAHPQPRTREQLAEAVASLDGLALAELLRLLHEDGFLTERTARSGAQNWLLSSELVLTWWQQRGLGKR